MIKKFVDLIKKTVTTNGVRMLAIKSKRYDLKKEDI